jgi:hypothetical protein
MSSLYHIIGYNLPVMAIQLNVIPSDQNLCWAWNLSVLSMEFFLKSNC